MRHLIHREQDAHTDGEGNQPQEQVIAGEPCWRVPREIIGNRDRHHGRIHERVSSSQAGPEIIRPIPHNGIGYCINHKRYEECRRHQRSGNAEHLTVIEQKKIVEAIVLDPVGNTSDAKRNTRHETRFTV